MKKYTHLCIIKLAESLMVKMNILVKRAFLLGDSLYTDDSCISFIQFAIREELMDFNVVIRSSDIENTFEHDLKFYTTLHLSAIIDLKIIAIK